MSWKPVGSFIPNTSSSFSLTSHSWTDSKTESLISTRKRNILRSLEEEKYIAFISEVTPYVIHSDVNINIPETPKEHR